MIKTTKKEWKWPRRLYGHVDERTVWHLCGTPKQNVCANSRTVRAQVCIDERGWVETVHGRSYI